jgi:hypothetical protein
MAHQHNGRTGHQSQLPAIGEGNQRAKRRRQDLIQACRILAKTSKPRRCSSPFAERPESERKVFPFKAREEHDSALLHLEI